MSREYESNTRALRFANICLWHLHSDYFCHCEKNNTCCQGQLFAHGCFFLDKVKIASIFANNIVDDDHNRNTSMDIYPSDTIEYLVHFNNLGVEHLKLGHFEPATSYLARALLISRVLLNRVTIAVAEEDEEEEAGGSSTLYTASASPTEDDGGAARVSPGYLGVNEEEQQQQQQDAASLRLSSPPLVSLRPTLIPDVHRQVSSRLFRQEGGGTAASPLVEQAVDPIGTSTIFRGAFYLCLENVPQQLLLLAPTATRCPSSTTTVPSSYAEQDEQQAALVVQTLNSCAITCVFNLAVCSHLHSVELFFLQQLQRHFAAGGGVSDDEESTFTGSSSNTAVMILAVKASKLYDYTYVLITECSAHLLGAEQVALIGMLGLATLNNRIHAHSFFLFCAGDQALIAEQEQLFVSVFVLLQQQSSIGSSGLFLLSSSSQSSWGETTTRRRVKRRWNRMQQQDHTPLLDDEEEEQEEGGEDEFAIMVQPILTTLSRILLLDPCLAPAA